MEIALDACSSRISRKAPDLFGYLDVMDDREPRSAAMNMAIDEALLESAEKSLIRFYRWDHPALSFGYFGKFTDVADEAAGHDLVRRWTGGGIVFHGEDLTYSIVIPAPDPAFAESPMSIYAAVHGALRDALAACGEDAELAQGRDAALRRPRTAQRAVPTGACFANAVRADVMLGGRKIAGAAQRRTRRGLLQQGSIQQVELAPDFEMKFAEELATKVRLLNLDSAILDRANEIAVQKYGTESWLQRR